MNLKWSTGNLSGRIELRRICPRSHAHRHTQVRVSRKSRHFGRDAEIQAMDGNKSVVQMLDSDNRPTHSFMFAVAGTSVVVPSLPSLDAGFRHPCRNDGSPTLVHNGERWSMGTRTKSMPVAMVMSTAGCGRFVRIDRGPVKPRIGRTPAGKARGD